MDSGKLKVGLANGGVIGFEAVAVDGAADGFEVIPERGLELESWSEFSDVVGGNQGEKSGREDGAERFGELFSDGGTHVADDKAVIADR